ncbi:MAG TPA: sugar phosphate isomerase/epimerase family protein, partial [Caldilineaceae bacterium]|nr:sugar phosphate isomerase/epimerase family protein [Caldilineaceae bacterium]
MKLSCLPVSLYPELSAGRWRLADWFRFAGELGLDGADVSVVHLGGTEPAHLATLRRQAEDAGVQIAMLVTYADFTHPDAAERRRQVDELRRYIAVAQALGAGFIRVTAGQAHPGLDRAAALGWAVAGLTACLDEAAQAGVTLAYENHTKGYAWTYNDFSQPADIFLEIVARTEGTGLRILYDTANTLAAGDDPLAVLEQVKRRVAVLHTNDIARAGYFEPVLLGEGAAPIVPIYRTMVNLGFDGWISVEEASKQGEAG